MINEDILNDLNDLESSEHPSNNQIDELEEEDDEDLPSGKLSQLISNSAFLEHMASISAIVDKQIEKEEKEITQRNDNNSKLIQKAN